MPSGRSSRSRNRSKSTAARRTRARLRNNEASHSPARGDRLRGDDREPEGAAAVFGWPAILGNLWADICFTLEEMWANRHAGMFILFIWTMLFLSYYLSPGFPDSVSSEEYAEWNKENTDDQDVDKHLVFKELINFFSPTTCIPKVDQKVQPCPGGLHLNQSACLRYKCCYSETTPFKCFAAFKDVPAQMFRMFALGVGSIIVLGFLPVFCFSLCRRSKWANPLLRKINRVLRGFQRQRNRPRQHNDVLEEVSEEEDVAEDNVDVQEARALVPRR